MTKIIVIANQKGGTGKTTISMNLATILSEKYRVVVLDSDPQATAYRWKETNYNLPFSVVKQIPDEKKITEQIKGLSQRHDYVIIDCRPSADDYQTFIAGLTADLILVPCLPSLPDLWASLAVRDTIKKIQGVNQNCQAAIVLNQFQPNLSVTKALLPLLEHLEIPVLKTKLGLRTVFKESAGNVDGITSHSKSKALQEIRDLAGEIQQLLTTQNPTVTE